MKNKIKILHLDYDDLENSFGPGGQAVITQKLYSLNKDDFEVTILTGNYPGAKNNITIANCTFKRIGIGNMGPKISLLSFWALIPFAILTMQKKFDVIVECFTAPFSASFGFLTAKKPYLIIPTFLGAKALSKKYNLPFYLIESLGLKMNKNFLVATKQIANYVKKSNPKANINILAYGYDKKLQSLPAKEKNYALFLGRIDIYNKGLDILLKGWVEVIKKYPDLNLYIAGKGKENDEKQFKNLIKRYNLSKNVLLQGKVDGEKKEKLLSECLFAIVPSRFETFCISALETLAVGKPLVKSGIEELSWIPTNAAITYNTNNPEALRNACFEVIENKKKRIKMGKTAKEFAKLYTWDAIGKKYNKIIKEFLNV